MSLIDVSGLVKTFERCRAPWGAPRLVRAVDRVSFAIDEGETFGLVGESGSGKTTTVRCLLRLIEPTAGSFLFRGEQVFGLPASRMRALRRDMQMIFQDADSSLNPRMRAGAIVEEGLAIHGVGSPADRRARVRELFELVGLDAGMTARYPHEFSGGQRQRVGIARALALGPPFLVADEPVSALDVSIQAQVVNLLMDLQQRLGLTLLLVAHDLRLVRHLCSRVAVMYRGRIVETGGTDALFGAPAHPYTRALLSAIPDPGPGGRRPRTRYDAATFDAEADLREVAPGHWAATGTGPKR
jgi:peptide/nickel transport system ATP-binding protein/oligopeptide transport system ATP-binding protein